MTCPGMSRCYLHRVLTRMQVARRLGKSVATVRRLEGHSLNPVRDGRGIHRFHPEEVERLARGERPVPSPNDAAPALRADADQLDIGELEDKLRDATDRAWVAEHQLERVRRSQREIVTGLDERLADFATECEAIRLQNRDLREIVQRTAAVLAENEKRELRALAETMLEFLGEQGQF